MREHSRKITRHKRTGKQLSTNNNEENESGETVNTKQNGRRDTSGIRNIESRKPGRKTKTGNLVGKNTAG